MPLGRRSGGPVSLPDPTLALGAWYGGSAYLVRMQPLAQSAPQEPSSIGHRCQSPTDEEWCRFHVALGHNEREIPPTNIFPRGMMMIDGGIPGFVIDESNYLFPFQCEA